jgi:hypothetical protein
MTLSIKHRGCECEGGTLAHEIRAGNRDSFSLSAESKAHPFRIQKTLNQIRPGVFAEVYFEAIPNRKPERVEASVRVNKYTTALYIAVQEFRRKIVCPNEMASQNEAAIEIEVIAGCTRSELNGNTLNGLVLRDWSVAPRTLHCEICGAGPGHEKGIFDARADYVARFSQLLTGAQYRHVRIEAGRIVAIHVEDNGGALAIRRWKITAFNQITIRLGSTRRQQSRENRDNKTTKFGHAIETMEEPNLCKEIRGSGFGLPSRSKLPCLSGNQRSQQRARLQTSKLPAKNSTALYANAT